MFNETFSLNKPVLVKTLAPRKTGQVKLSFCSKEQMNNLANLVIRYRHFYGTGARWGVFSPFQTLRVSRDVIEWKNGILQTNAQINKQNYWRDTSLVEYKDGVYLKRYSGGVIEADRLIGDWFYWLEIYGTGSPKIHTIDTMFFRIKPTPFVVENMDSKEIIPEIIGGIPKHE